MSFYGQIIQEFTKLFSKLTVSQTSTSTTPVSPPESNTDFSYEANNMWETMNIAPSNRWIQLRDASEGNTKALTIGHGSAGESDKIVHSVETTTAIPEDATATSLKSGNLLKIATTEYDKAGHLSAPQENSTNPSYKYYKLPELKINIGNTGGDSPTPIDISTNSEDDKLYFQGDNWINLSQNSGALKISHSLLTKIDDDPKNYETINIFDDNASYTTTTADKLIEEMLGTGITEANLPVGLTTLNTENPDTSVTPLQSGDIIVTSILDKDDRGHIIGSSQKYWQLPVSRGEADFTAHESRLDTLDTLLKISGGDGSYSKNMELLTAHNDFLTEGFNTDYFDPTTQKLSDLTGCLSQMYASKDEKYSLAETIGPIDAEGNSIKTSLKTMIAGYNETPTVSSAIQAIIEKYNNLSAALTNVQAVSSFNRTDLNLTAKWLRGHTYSGDTIPAFSNPHNLWIQRYEGENHPLYYKNVLYDNPEDSNTFSGIIPLLAEACYQAEDLHAAYNEICSPLYYKNLKPSGYDNQDFLWKHFGLCNESANVVDASKVTQILRTLLLFHTRLNELEGKDANASYGKNIFDYNNMPNSGE